MSEEKSDKDFPLAPIHTDYSLGYVAGMNAEREKHEKELAELKAQREVLESNAYAAMKDGECRYVTLKPSALNDESVTFVPCEIIKRAAK